MWFLGFELRISGGPERLLTAEPSLKQKENSRAYSASFIIFKFIKE